MSVANKENSYLDQKSCFVLSVAQIIIYSQLLNSVAYHLGRQAFFPFVFSIYHFDRYYFKFQFVDSVVKNWKKSKTFPVTGR
jgi:hypothetical protein